MDVDSLGSGWSLWRCKDAAPQRTASFRGAINMCACIMHTACKYELRGKNCRTAVKNVEVSILLFTCNITSSLPLRWMRNIGDISIETHWTGSTTRTHTQHTGAQFISMYNIGGMRRPSAIASEKLSSLRLHAPLAVGCDYGRYNKRIE